MKTKTPKIPAVELPAAPVQEGIRMVSYFNDHWYLVKRDGADHYIASVTSKLGIEKKPFVDQWRGDIGNREADLRMNEASNRGKRIHFAWYTFLTGGTILYNPWEAPNYTDDEIKKLETDGPVFILKSQDEMLQMWKLQRFFKIVNPKILHAELKVYSIEHDIAGTLDNAFQIEAGTYDVNGRSKLVIPVTGIYICDLKTGKVVDDSVWNQIAPYAKCYQWMGHGRPEGGIVLHTGSNIKSGIPGLSVPFRSAEQLKHDFEVYQKIADIWKERNPNYGPQIFDFPSLIKK